MRTRTITSVSLVEGGPALRTVLAPSGRESSVLTTVWTPSALVQENRPTAPASGTSARKTTWPVALIEAAVFLPARPNVPPSGVFSPWAAILTGVAVPEPRYQPIGESPPVRLARNATWPPLFREACRVLPKVPAEPPDCP